MSATGLAGTEDLSLSAALRALEEQRPSCTLNADDLVAKAMEELRQEAKCGAKQSEEELAWALSYAIAVQHVHEQSELNDDEHQIIIEKEHMGKRSRSGAQQ